LVPFAPEYRNTEWSARDPHSVDGGAITSLQCLGVCDGIGDNRKDPAAIPRFDRIKGHRFEGEDELAMRRIPRKWVCRPRTKNERPFFSALKLNS
jgi:hypothetical protein